MKQLIELIMEAVRFLRAFFSGDMTREIEAFLADECDPANWVTA